jgi:DNA repair protein RadD
MVLSYGFNVPHVDLIAMLRPTMSTGLYVQQVGRGTRKAEGKSECLILDFAENVRRHGPVDAVEVQIDDRERKKGEAPVKTCPSCREIVMLAAKECPCCGHVFPGRDISHKPIADTVEILVSQRKRSDWLEVEDVHCAYHAKDPPSLRVSYQCGFESYRKWVCLEHQGWARIFAEKWWRQMTGGEQPPRTVDEALQRQDELLTVTHIQVAPAGKYWEITAYRVELEDGETREFDRNMNRMNVPPPPPPPINDEIRF